MSIDDTNKTAEWTADADRLNELASQAEAMRITVPNYAGYLTVTLNISSISSEELLRLERMLKNVKETDKTDKVLLALQSVLALNAAVGEDVIVEIFDMDITWNDDEEGTE